MSLNISNILSESGERGERIPRSLNLNPASELGMNSIVLGLLRNRISADGPVVLESRT